MIRVDETIIKKFEGHSGSEIFLIKNDSATFVRKIHNIDRNYDRLVELKGLGFDVPCVYHKGHNYIDIEYIKGFDMRTYLNNNNIEHFCEYLFDLISKFSNSSVEKDYTDTYYSKLKWLDNHPSTFPFSKDELIESLPKKLPQSVYHGDLTMENILYNGRFYMIDCMTSEYDSWVFDLSKLRQDLKAKWIIRNYHDINIENYLNIIDERVIKKYSVLNNQLLILMLLRIWPYVKDGSNDQEFLLENIKHLWT